MQIKFVYKVLPAFIIYTDFMPDNFSGATNAMIVRIRPHHKDDQGLLEHELVHVRQSYRLFFLIHAVLYLASKRYRLYSEVEAYRKQLWYSLNIDYLRGQFAGFIAEKYNLDITKEQALELLQ